MSVQHCMIVTAGVLRALTDAQAGWGWLELAVSEGEGLSSIEAYTCGEGYAGVRIGGLTRDLPEGHRLRTSDSVPAAAIWYRAKPEVPLALMHEYMRRRPHAAYPIEEFREFITQGWREPSVDGLFYAVVEDRSANAHSWTAWNLAGGAAVPASLITLDRSIDLSAVFEGHWPLDDVRRATVAVIGVGSIGSAAALTLCDYQIGTIVLIDPDRLLPHNVARHRCAMSDVGRFKVDAVRDLIRAADTNAAVRSLRYDVIRDADLVRPVLDDVDIVICCADGVAARQTTSHLCSQAQTAGVFACVLDNGAIGEIVRVPVRDDVGCLRCQRRALEASGAMDPEPGLDLEYGTGTTHRPMTAIAGDLALMGAVAAKAAVSTILERAGYRDQRWTGDHLVVGLRPDSTWAHPFDQDRVLGMTVTPMPPPDPNCPLCCGDNRYA